MKGLHGVFSLAAAFLVHEAIASTTSGPYQIKSVLFGGYGVHIEVAPTPPGCTADWSGSQLVILTTQSNYKDLLAAALAAQAEGKSIIVFHDPQGNGTCGFGNQLSVVALQIKS